MFKVTTVILYRDSCPRVLSSLRLATLHKKLPQEIITNLPHIRKDPEGYNSLARTLAFKHPCSAIAYDSHHNKLYIGFNNHAKDFTILSQAQKFIHPPVETLVEEHIGLLTKSHNNPALLKNLIGLVISRSHAYPLFSLRPVPNKLKQLADDTEIFSTTLLKIKHEINKFIEKDNYILDNNEFFDLYMKLVTNLDSSQALRSHYMTEVLQPLLDVLKIYKLYSSHPIAYKILDNPASHHAELAILKYCHDSKINLDSIGIGISKLSCFICHIVLKHYGIKEIGTHGLLYVEHHSKVLEDFFSEDKLCLKVCAILNKYISKQQNLKGIAKNWEDLDGIEHKQIPEASKSYRSESYLLDFSDDAQFISQTLETLGLNEVKTIYDDC
jgi:hypothetical protein